MTPQERDLVSNLFDRLTQLEKSTRDSDAEQAIAEGLKRAPNATYALVQTVLVQDEALKRADARIRELEAEFEDDNAPPQSGFLDNICDSLFGRREPRGSVPAVRPGEKPMGVPPGFQAGLQANAQTPEPPSQGGSFLGTAAAAAAGVVGGAFLLEAIRSMMGHGSLGTIGQAHAATATASPLAASPLGTNTAASQAAADGESEGLDDFSDDFDIGDLGGSDFL